MKNGIKKYCLWSLIVFAFGFLCVVLTKFFKQVWPKTSLIRPAIKFFILFCVLFKIALPIVLHTFVHTYYQIKRSSAPVVEIGKDLKSFLPKNSQGNNSHVPGKPIVKMNPIILTNTVIRIFTNTIVKINVYTNFVKETENKFAGNEEESGCFVDDVCVISSKKREPLVNNDILTEELFLKQCANTINNVHDRGQEPYQTYSVQYKSPYDNRMSSRANEMTRRNNAISQRNFYRRRG